MTHRAVTALLFGKRENHGSLTLDKAGVHCSERERAAAEAEHKAVDILRAELFKSRIGSVMNGTVTAVTESGAFVRLGDTGAEGLLRGARLKPGAKISVTITAVDAAKGQIDLSSSAQQANIPPEARWQVSRRDNRKHGPGRGRGRRR